METELTGSCSRVSSALTCAPGRRCYIHADPRQISPTAASLTDWDLNDARVHTHLNLTEPSAVWIPRIHEVTAVRLPAFGGIRRRRRIGRAWISRRHLHIHLKLLHFFFSILVSMELKEVCLRLYLAWCRGLVRWNNMLRKSKESTKKFKYGRERPINN